MLYMQPLKMRFHTTLIDLNPAAVKNIGDKNVGITST